MARKKSAPRSDRAAKPNDALDLIVRASATLISSPRISMVLPRIIDLARELIPADAYGVWRKMRSGEWTVAYSDGIDLPDDGDAGRIHAVRAHDIPSEVIAASDVNKSAVLEARGAFYRAHGIRSVLVLPLTIRYELTGTLALYFRRPHAFEQREIDTGRAFANLASAALSTAELYEEQIRLRNEAEAAEQRYRFLANVSSTLATSLDYQLTLGTLARLVVPTIADWCAIDMLEPGGSLNRLAVAHVDPAKVRLARELQKRYPTDLNAPEGLAKVLRTGEASWIFDVPEALIENAARDPEHLRILRELAIRSAIVVPLTGHTGVLGAMSLIQAESGRRFDKNDVEFVREIAARASLFIENSRLYSEARELARRRDSA